MEYPLDVESSQRILESFQARYRGTATKIDLVWMKPDEFLEQCPSPVTTKLSAYHTPLLYFSESSLKNLAGEIMAKRKLDPLYLDYNSMFYGWPSHEGRHRAIIAKRFKMEKVPVIVIRPTGK